ncbi:DNA double-strand break repair ATPase Rad50 [Halomarina oriensis]|uniref:DNA double-strand break repair Rad50 ATPase n=1 Tax=Halomarina oriensis TaxID=671145 RepID=A0A6B0GNQ8_9EURY|nr:DNA double-strand break repair ATPase Rad50 [Halomarina oriensis]MWG36442.1 DNA double-strand break repair ATPase Rad50 [Halomarina oriensis]
MRFERVRLENFKCYADADVDLDDGVTVIFGLNGSGKSSLLEACFFALYGATALDTTLDEVVTIGAEDATVELWFVHGGERYHLERRVRSTAERAQTATCVLETPQGSVEGARDVRGFVEDLLRMDAEAFVNCAYVRQGEVNKLINASPGDRQDMIDDLLQLGTLEEYRERASMARRGVGRVRDAKRELLDDKRREVAEKEEADLHGRLNRLRTERDRKNEKIEEVEERREQAVKTRDHEQRRLDEATERRERLDDLAETIEELRERIAEAQRERQEHGDRLSELRETADDAREEREELLAASDLDAADPSAIDERLDVLEDRDDELRDRLEAQRIEAQNHSNRAERLRDEADALDERADEARTEAETADAEATDRADRVEERRETIEERDADIAEKRARFEQAPCDRDTVEEYRERTAERAREARDRVTSLDTELGTARDSLTEAERLRDEGKCPECGQPVEDSPHVEAIADRRDRVEELEAELADAREAREEAEARLETAEELVALATDLASLESKQTDQRALVESAAEDVTEKRERAERLREQADEFEADAAEKREEAGEAAAAADDCREVVAEVNAERQTVKTARERLDALADAVERLADAEAERERLREDREKLDSMNDERRERLREVRDQREELAEAFDEAAIEKARTNRDGAEEYVEWADDALPTLREQRDDLQGDVGAVRNELAALDDLRERRDALEATVERLDTLYEETEELQEMYAGLRAELRQRNVDKLESLLNETFDLVYQNDSYARIELDGDYSLTVYQKDGEPLDPEQLSGGERALFNLSLRCAIYRLLAEGIEGAAPMPPLILDEPTVFLDSGHVSKLVELVESMRDVGVEQIVVVSHDEELVGAADDLIHVEKDPTSNRSTVERENELVSVLAD